MMRGLDDKHYFFGVSPGKNGCHFQPSKHNCRLQAYGKHFRQYRLRQGKYFLYLTAHPDIFVLFAEMVNLAIKKKNIEITKIKIRSNHKRIKPWQN